MQHQFIILSLLLAMILAGCAPDRTHLQRIKDNGVLQVVTRNTPAAYFQGPFGPAGLEYDLTREFADYLGVELNIIVEDN